MICKGTCAADNGTLFPLTLTPLFTIFLLGVLDLRFRTAEIERFGTGRRKFNMADTAAAIAVFMDEEDEETEESSNMTFLSTVLAASSLL